MIRHAFTTGLYALCAISCAALTGCDSIRDESGSTKVRFITYARENQIPGGNPSGTPSPSVSPTGLPSVPAYFRGLALGPFSIALAWDISSGAVAGYRIYRDQNLVAVQTGTYYEEAGLGALSTHAYQVEAFDSDGHLSGRSSLVSLTTLAATDLTRVVSMNPTSTGTLPVFDATLADELVLNIVLQDNGAAIAGAQFYKITPKNLTAADRASAACLPKTMVDQTNAAQLHTVTYCSGVGPLQEMTPLGGFIGYSAADKVAGISVTFKQAVASGALSVGPSVVGVALADLSGNSALLVRSIIVSQ